MDNNKSQLIDLWRTSFNDSEEFIKLFFDRVYKKENGLFIEKNGKIVSALQMLPYPMSFCGKQVATSYISGACTHPDFRNRGVMRQLLSQAFARMLPNGIFFSTLIPANPWLFDYYARIGYAPVFQYSTKEIILPEFIPSKEIKVDIVSEYKEEVYSYLNKKLAERPCCIQHTTEDFEVIMADLAISNGILLVAKLNNEINGIAIVYKRDESVIINELLVETKDAEHSLLFHLKQHTGCNRMIQLLPPDKKRPQQALGMARIINAKEVLQLYAATFPEDEMQIEVCK